MDIDSFNFKPFGEQYDVSVLHEQLGLTVGQVRRSDRPMSPNTNGLISETWARGCYEPWTGGSITFDILDIIRADAREDFMRNGVEREMDEVDRIQIRHRNNSGCCDPTPSLEPNNIEPVEYVRPSKGRRGSKNNKLKALKSYCVFCKNNGERVAVYSSHFLKDENGKVRCPILRRYTCPVCYVSGDNAHTIRYCPKASEERAAAASVLMSARLSNGKDNPRGSN